MVRETTGQGMKINTPSFQNLIISLNYQLWVEKFEIKIQLLNTFLPLAYTRRHLISKHYFAV
jgi:hypothetical protein